MFIKTSMFSNADLVQLVRNRSRMGMTMIFDEYAKVLFLAIFRLVPIQAEAENILEQTFLKIYRTVDTYPIKNESFFTWMMIIARQFAKESLIKRFTNHS